MLRRIVLYLGGQTVLTLVLHFIWRWLPKALTENAVTSWLDDKIAEALGWTAPSAAAVTSWLIPLVLVGALLAVYHIIYVRWAAQPLGETLPQPEPRQMIIAGLIIIAVGFILGAGIISVGLWREAKMPLIEATADPNAAQPTTPAEPSSSPAAIPRTQPYRMTNNHLRPDRQAVIRPSDNATISPDKDNADFKIYIAWLAAKNMPDPVEATLAPVYAARSPSDAEKEIPIVDKLYDLIHTGAAPLPEKGADLVRGWSAIIAFADESSSYTKKADKFYYELER
jgi:hypothetical protein